MGRSETLWTNRQDSRTRKVADSKIFTDVGIRNVSASEMNIRANVSLNSASRSPLLMAYFGVASGWRANMPRCPGL